MEKLWSFSSRSNSNIVGTDKLEWEEEEEEENNLLEQLDDKIHLSQVLEDVDYFLNSVTTPNSSSTDEVPNCVVLLHKLLESMIDKYNKPSRGTRIKFGRDPEIYKSFLDAVERIFKLSITSSLGDLYLDRTSSILEKAMFILENDICALLQRPKSKIYRSTPTPTTKKSASFGSLQLHFQLQDERDSLRLNNQDDDDDDDDGDLLPNFSLQELSIMNNITTSMIAAGYHLECCMAITAFRRNSFKNVLRKLGYTFLKMDEVYKMQWDLLEGEIVTWNKVFRHCTNVLFKAERKLYDSIFSNQPSLSRTMFGDLVRLIIIHFLNFAQAVVLTKPSPEKLFKFLDMYETLRDELEPIIVLMNDDGLERCAKDLTHEAFETKHGIIKVVVEMFYDLENSIKGDNHRIPVPYGAIHPLTRYVMNYLKYACEYKVTLEQVFFQYSTDQFISTTDHYHYVDDHNKGTSTTSKNIPELDKTLEKSPFVVQLMRIMDLLDENTENKSKLYKDMALRCVFLMNNGRYIVQKIKGCADLHESMVDDWCRRKQTSLKMHHKSYQRETWSNVLQCLKLDGLHQQGNKVSKQVLRDKFKCFNSLFEEIHKTQSSWMVSDEQLQSELRVSISALVIPAYRSFMGRFKHYLESGRHVDKYIKYHPDDIEILIDDFFVGNATSMPRRKI
ncbi:exocyst complex component EXO70C1-like [Vicia villosa]|uniref:exocyst complex component EXO70C1-like n=1 Tax=Vicia villosa TaxID=3911 RepID=UPI00273C3726|nr:exocyst complex component EXO70C1-like [Vicia villosa]